MAGKRILALLLLTALGSRLHAQVPLRPEPPPPLALPPMDGFMASQPVFLSAIPEPDVFFDIGPGWKLLAGAGFDLVAPFVENDRALTLTTPLANGGTSIESVGFCHPVAVAPRFWLGLAAGNGWGFRTSYWHFDQSRAQSASLDGDSPAGSAIVAASPLGLGISTGTFVLAKGNADVLAVANSLNVNVLDFEATREIDAGPMFLVLSGGGRYARLAQRYLAGVVNTDNDFLDKAEVDLLQSHQRFVGWGPTLALQGWYALGLSRLAIYGSVRGTLLFGEARQAASTTQILASGGTMAAYPLSDVSAYRPTVVPVAELEMGIQWSGNWRRLRPFLRTGVLAQTWLDALSTSTVPTSGGDSANINSNLSFLGVVFQAGMNY